jgi:hypothetical protein
VALHQSFPRERACREAAFAPGGCLLFRRDVWERIGGLDDFSRSAFEDYHLSKKILAHGHRLILNDRHPVYEKRHLDRAGYCRRQAAYESPLAAVIIDRRGLASYLRDAGAAMRPGLDYFQRTGDPVLVYVLLLKTALVFSSLAAGRRDALGSAFIRSMLDRFDAWPRTCAFFLRDLRRLNREPPPASPPVSAASPAAAEMNAFLASLPLAEVGEALEEKWLDVYLKEDATLLFDWHYTQGAGGDSRPVSRARGGRPSSESHRATESGVETRCGGGLKIGQNGGVVHQAGIEGLAGEGGHDGSLEFRPDLAQRGA